MGRVTSFDKKSKHTVCTMLGCVKRAYAVEGLCMQHIPFHGYSSGTLQTRVVQLPSSQRTYLSWDWMSPLLHAHSDLRIV